MYSTTTDGSVSTSYTSTMQTREETVNGVVYVGFNNTNRNYYAKGRVKSVIMTDYISISPDKQYSVRFSHNTNYSSPYIITVYVVVYSGGSITKIPLYEETFNGSSSSWSNFSDFSFKIPSSTLGTSYKCRLYIEHSVGAPYHYGDESGIPWQFIQRYIEVVDDDVSWLVKILNAIKAIPSNISGFFTSLGNRISGFLTTLGDRISGFFTVLKTNIGDWFTTQLQKIQDFYNGVKQWFKELGDRIQQFFIDLYNDIVEGLKSLFIPSDGYFESKKTELDTFVNVHFGAMYQAPSVMANLIKKFLTLSPKQPSITMPAIQFDFDGKRYVLSESITYSFAWVNDSSHMLYYFYKFYRGFVVVLLFVWFGNFCINKYNEVFGGRKE